MILRPGVVGSELGEEIAFEKHRSTELFLKLGLYLSYILGSEYCSRSSSIDGSIARAGTKDFSVI